jgi:hypothetical protein
VDDAVVRALPGVVVAFHEDVQALAGRFLAEQRRHYYVTPTRFALRACCSGFGRGLGVVAVDRLRHAALLGSRRARRLLGRAVGGEGIPEDAGGRV